MKSRLFRKPSSFAFVRLYWRVGPSTSLSSLVQPEVQYIIDMVDISLNDDIISTALRLTKMRSSKVEELLFGSNPIL